MAGVVGVVGDAVVEVAGRLGEVELHLGLQRQLQLLRAWAFRVQGSGFRV